MYNIENKRIAVTIILIALVGIVLCWFLRQDISIPITSRTTADLYENVPDDYRFIRQIKSKDAYQPDKALYEYDSHYIIDGVSIFGLQFKYKNSVTIFIILLGISIYLFLYKNDNQLKSGLTNLKRCLILRKNEKQVKAKSYILFSLILLSVIALIILCINYYSSLQGLHRPLTWGESIFMGFTKVFLIVTVISTVIGIIKSALTSKQ